jgi:hypothetical protein
VSEEERYEQLRQVCVSYRNEVADLEVKLAEKDELIGTLKNKYECADRELYLTKDTLKHHTSVLCTNLPKLP